MRVGIIGYEGSGKTTIFSALAGIDPEQAAAQRSYIWEVKVPDERIDKLSAMYSPKKTIYATVQFVDVMAQSAATGKRLSAEVVAKIRESDVLAVVVRGFDNGYEEAKPALEAASMMSDLLLADMEIVERKVERMQKDRSSEQEKALFLRMQAALEEGTWLKDLEFEKAEEELLRGYQLMTLKPVIVVVNVSESEADELSAAKYEADLADVKAPIFVLSAKVEGEIALMDEEDQTEFLKDLGIKATARDRFIRAAYKMLDLISFFTVGEDEVRAWTVKNGATAQESAGKIHTDLAKCFIRAERMSSTDLLELGSEARVKEAGKFELKGKTYITQDGDILHIRANA
ncbi:MAG: DUF933 domain-containing protein [Bradymonadales bacterium]